MKTTMKSLLVAVVFALVLGGGAGLARSATAPPSLLIEVIGAGKVTGTGINCGLGLLTCSATYSDATPVTLTPTTTVSGWTFDHWEDGCAASPCDATPAAGGTTVTAVFTHSAGTLTYQHFSVSLSASPPVGAVVNGSVSYEITCGDAGPTPPTSNCDLSVPQSSTITVQEQPDAGYVFNGWGGSCSGTKTTCAVYLKGDRAVSADFVSSDTTTLKVTVDGSGTVSGSGLSCGSGATCTKQEPPTATITLTATPASGYAFTGWSGGSCSGTQTTCTVQMSTDQDVTASFDPLVPVLITVNGAGTVSGANVTCGPGPATCNGSAAPDSTIQLQATPSVTGGTETWVGCSSASGPICNVLVGTDPKSVSVTFSGGTTGGGGGSFVTLTVTVSGNGYVTSTGAATLWCTAAGGAGCVANVQQNSSVTLHANPASNDTNDFDSWTNCASGSTTCTVTMSSAKAITANFEPPDNTTYNLKASVAGGGSVTGGGLKCTSISTSGCTGPEPASAHITLDASPNPGQVFVGWSGDCTGTSPLCTVTMTGEHSVTATFQSTAPSTLKLSVAVLGGGQVDVGTAKCIGTAAKPAACVENVKAGVVDLKAVPAKGFVFAGWSGACAGKKTTCALDVVADAKVTATFKALPLSAGPKKPAVAKLRTGYRITITFRAGEAGRLTVTGKPTTATIHRTVKAALGTVRITVKKHGRYVITLSLRSKSGTHRIHYAVKV